MAAYLDDANRIIEEDAQKRIIEKAIIKSTLGKYRSPFSLFSRGTEFIIERIDSTLIGKISEETRQDQKIVKDVLTELSNPRRIPYIFELTAEVRLEKISTEERSEIEHLLSFSYFLTDAILYYPCPEHIKKASIKISSASGVETGISIEIPAVFSEIYDTLTSFQKTMEQKIVTLEEQVREQISEQDRENLREKERDAISLKEKKRFAEVTLQAFNELLPTFREYLVVKSVDSYEEKFLARQLTAVKTALQTLQNRLEGKSAEKEEDKTLSIDREDLLEQIKTFFMKNYGMSEEDALREAQAVLERAQNSKDLGLAPSAPALPNSSEPQQAPKNFKSNLAEALKAAVLRKTSGSSVDSKKAGEQAESFILGIGGISAGAIQNRQREISEAGAKKAQSSIRKAIPYKGELDIKRYPLAEFETLHVLSALPEGEELNQLDNGYILIGHEKPASARLYYLHKDKKDKLVECNPGNLNSLCEHVKKSSEGEVTRLTLDRKQQLDLIINFCGGHKHKLAEDAVLAPVLVAESSSSQSGPSASSSSRVPQKKSLFDEYGIVLLKDGQDWPEEMADKTLYFKWDNSKKMLAVQYKKEDGAVSGHERPIIPRKVKLVSGAFEQLEGTTLTSDVKGFLLYFAANPIAPRMSVVLPKKELIQSPQNDVPAVASSGKEEEVEKVEEERGRKEEEKGKAEEKEEEKEAAVPKAGSSPRVETQLSSSPLSLLASPKSLAKESSANSLAEGSGADSQPDARKMSPRK